MAGWKHRTPPSKLHRSERQTKQEGNKDRKDFICHPTNTSLGLGLLPRSTTKQTWQACLFLKSSSFTLITLHTNIGNISGFKTKPSLCVVYPFPWSMGSFQPSHNIPGMLGNHHHPQLCVCACLFHLCVSMLACDRLVICSQPLSHWPRWEPWDPGNKEPGLASEWMDHVDWFYYFCSVVLVSCFWCDFSLFFFIPGLIASLINSVSSAHHLFGHFHTYTVSENYLLSQSIDLLCLWLVLVCFL